MRALEPFARSKEMKVTGFDAIQKKLDQMARFAEEVDGTLATVSFDADDPESIEAALQEIRDAIDEKTRSYERNDWVQDLAEQLKENARNQVLEEAAAARTGSKE
jgi:tRNA threonylcarbamoyladenosine modification (KEOPS) complex Cgi121 subunit